MRIPVGEKGLNAAKAVGAPENYLPTCYIGLGYSADDKPVIEQVEYSAKQKIHLVNW